MYHEITYTEIKARKTHRIVAVVVVALIAVCLALLLSMSQAAAREQGALTLRESIVSAAAQCCAVEGSYPSSLSHLESHYGLVINHSDYAVNYEWLGDNIPPSVVVTLR